MAAVSLPMDGFNTQPPEGGWANIPIKAQTASGFNTQPPEGGWASTGCGNSRFFVSTHSRPKAAGFGDVDSPWVRFVSTHSRPKAAGKPIKSGINKKTFQHTAARRRLVTRFFFRSTFQQFQHTAARRRLGVNGFLFFVDILVSTHSRPKAAGS